MVYVTDSNFAACTLTLYLLSNTVTSTNVLLDMGRTCATVNSSQLSADCYTQRPTSVTSSRHAQQQTFPVVYNERKGFNVLLKKSREIINEEEKSKTVDLSGMMSRICMRSFVTIRCVLTKP